MLVIAVYEAVERKLAEAAKWLLAAHGFTSAIRVFTKIFLAAYFLKVTAWNMGLVALFYIALYSTNAIAFRLIANITKIGNRLRIFRIGIVFYAAFLITVVLLGANIGHYIFLLGIVFGIADGLYWLPYNTIRFEVNAPKDRALAFSYEKSMEDSIKVVSPVIIGYIISTNSYTMVFLLLLACTILALAVSFRIPSTQDLKNKPLDMKGFISQLKNEADVWRSYSGEFLRGINYIGALEIAVPVVILLSVESVFKLGILTSIFALLSILTALLVGKYLRDQKFKVTILVSGVLLFFSTALLIFDVSLATVLLYNTVFAITVPTLNVLQTTISYNVLKKEEFRVGHLIMREAFRNSGRVIGFLLLYGISVLFGSDLNWMRTALVVLSITILFLALDARKFKTQ